MDTGSSDADALGDRPGVADAYPGEHTPATSASPEVDQPHTSPESWAGDINSGYGAPGRRTNCGECARAAQGTWEGEPTVAAALSGPQRKGAYPDQTEDWAGQTQTSTSMADAGQQLEELGPGSSAVVSCNWQGGGGHWFNAVNDGGTVKAVDGQRGLVDQWPPSEDGFGFDESWMDRSHAIYFTADGKAVKK